MVKYSPIESEFASSEEDAAYDAWLKAKVERSLASTEPLVPHDVVMAQVREIIEKAERKNRSRFPAKAGIQGDCSAI